MRRTLLSVVAVSLITGCSEHRAPPAQDQLQGRAAASRAPMAFGQAKPELDEVVVTGTSDLAMPLNDPTSMIIRTATASIQIDSLEPAIAQLKQLAARVGGYVANSSLETGRSQLRKAEIELKIPAVRFDEALSGLNPIGKLESVDVQAEDVGEEFVDVSARMDNARRLERRLIDLLATRTGKLKDVLDVEHSLARVREEIERYEGRLRYLKAHTAVSTLTVTVHEPLPVVGTAGQSVMGEAFAQAWRNFVAFLAIVIQSLGVVLPLGVIAALAWIVARRLKLRTARTA